MVTDETQLPELTSRQENILELIIRSYTQTPEPVSSKFLLEKFDLSFSSATIRNEMSRLEELGYIKAPHTSAGRVPTELGYSYFVHRLISGRDLSSSEQTHITEKLQAHPTASEQWMTTVATTLSRTARSVALVTPTISEMSKFKHLELIGVQGRLVLMVLVLQQGTVNQQMLMLAEAFPQSRLSEAARHINQICVDLSANEVRMRSLNFQMLEREIGEVVADLMEKSDTAQVHLVYRDGLSQAVGLLSSQAAQQAVRVFEERSFLNMVLSEVASPVINDVEVVIAGNGKWEELSHLTVILSRYGISGLATGTVGVLGPTNINYGRAVSAVSYMSSVMTEMYTNLYQTKGDLPEPSRKNDES